MSKDIAAKLATQPDIADGLNMMGWWGAQTYDFAMGLNVSLTGFKLVAHGTTFESDPPDARAALEARAGYVGRYLHVLLTRRSRSRGALEP